MKRLLAVALGICIATCVFAQSSFTIVRPADGSKVREKIRILIPKNSIDEDSYVGIFLNSKFVEAVIPPVEGNYRVYTLDTKQPRPSEPEWSEGVPDGEAKIELVKYEGGDVPKIVDRSSVTVTIGNHMNIDVPKGGVYLRYGFQSGQSLIYDVHELLMSSTLSGIGNQNGGHPAQFPESELNYRMLYACDNKYANGDALLRLQNIADKGKDYSVLSIVGDPVPEQIFDFQMQPMYMRVDKTARPQAISASTGPKTFGSVPNYFGFSTGSYPENITFVYGGWPLPVLPDKAVYPGCPPWQTAFLLQSLSPEIDPFLVDKIAEPFQARGEFVDVEWELGHPCARIRNSIAEGTRSFAGQQLAKAGEAFGDDKVALDETIYFSLDTHKILQLVRTITIDHKEVVSTGQGAGAGGPAGPGGGGKMNVGGGSGMVAPPGGGGGGPVGAGLIMGGQQAAGGLTLPGGGKKGGAPGAGQRGFGTPGAPGGRTGGAPATRTQYIRQQFRQTFSLEQ